MGHGKIEVQGVPLWHLLTIAWQSPTSRLMVEGRLPEQPYDAVFRSADGSDGSGVGSTAGDGRSAEGAAGYNLPRDPLRFDDRPCPQGDPMKLPRPVLEHLIFAEGASRRYTQGSPVLPDVWIDFAQHPYQARELLLTPHRDCPAGQVALALRRRLDLQAGSHGDDAGGAPTALPPVEERGHRLVYTQSSVALRLTLEELVRQVLPMTGWWRQWFDRLEESLPRDRREAVDTLAGAMDELEQEEQVGPADVVAPPWQGEARPRPTVPVELAWMMRVVGWLLWARERQEEELGAHFPEVDDPEAWKAWCDAHGPGHRETVEAVLELVGDQLPRPVAPGEPAVWQVNRNRGASFAVRDSRLAVKADATQRLFDLRCDHLTWAVLDGGVDATHPAFRRRRADGTVWDHPFGEPEDHGAGRSVNRTRVLATYDFGRVRQLLNPTVLDHLLEPRVLERLNRELLVAERDGEGDGDGGGTVSGNAGPEVAEAEGADGEGGAAGSGEAWEPGELPQDVRQLADLAPLLTGETPRARELREQLDGEPANRQELEIELAEVTAGAARLRRQLSHLRHALHFGREVDWELLGPFLEVPHVYGHYRRPRVSHGTHVAGILAGDWPEEGWVGMAPDLGLYDLRVVPWGPGGDDDEFNVIAALQFIRHLNARNNFPVIHGANVSVSIPHEVANFACGRTPVCEECERLVASGVVVVAAAGNRGYVRYRTSRGEQEGYHTISITDPGNADSVITVGATHCSQPHTYGVSYFSSRGPTGDGRLKPDLVAPGEKVVGPVPGGGFKEKDGTSMAAPHVSGAAAMLMARYGELIGQPDRIKRILCDSATDLGREPYFQGRGMLDVLRALQSV